MTGTPASAGTPDLAALLPSPLPDSYNERMLLFAIRRMAAHGLADAHAAHALVGWFGLGFRRPLTLLRAFMAELSRSAERKLVVAPCCCRRMTRAEEAIVSALRQACSAPDRAHDTLAGVAGVVQCWSVLGAAQAVTQAFDDLGRPLSN